MPKFLLLGGDHTDAEGNKVVFEKGRETVVESDEDLVETFRDHFAYYEGPAPAMTFPKKGSKLSAKEQKAAAEAARAQDPAYAPRSVSPTDYPTLATAARNPQTVGGKGARGKSAAKPEGDDMTDDFEGAEDAGLAVYKVGRNYKVYDANNPSDPLHDEEFTTKPDVKSFIKSRAEEAEGDAEED